MKTCQFTETAVASFNMSRYGKLIYILIHCVTLYLFILCSSASVSERYILFHIYFFRFSSIFKGYWTADDLFLGKVVFLNWSLVPVIVSSRTSTRIVSYPWYSAGGNMSITLKWFITWGRGGAKYYTPLSAFF